MSTSDPRLDDSVKKIDSSTYNQKSECQPYVANSYRDRSPIRDEALLYDERKNNSKRSIKNFHANQKEQCYHYCNKPILPAVGEITKRRALNIQPNIVDGSYENWSHYLCTQFNLLREDFISPLRQGICDYMRGNEQESRLNIRVYKHVHVLEPVCLYTGIGYRIQFDTTYNYLQHVDWEHSNRLIFGSLLCLSSDRFTTILFATVSNREANKLKDGILEVQFENIETLKILKIEPQTEFIMAESTAYFEAYRHILTRLQHIEEDLPTLYESYIVRCDPPESILSPSYLSIQYTEEMVGDHICFDLSAVGCSQSINVLESKAWPQHDNTNLDKSQLAAVQMALTQNLSVIQGPPGTGKTYVGLKIMEILLQNRAQWYPLLQSPILVVSYTNHALDQFLEGILEFTKKEDNLKMVRIGGRCLSENIQSYTLKEYKKCRPSFILKYLNSKMRTKSAAINSGLYKCKQMEENLTILTLEDLSSEIYYRHILQFYSFKKQHRITEKDNVIEAWLLSSQGKIHKSNNVPMETNIDNDSGDHSISEYEMYAEAALLESDRILEGEQIKLEHESTFLKINKNHYTKTVALKIRDGLKCKPMGKQEMLKVKNITHLNSSQRWSLYHYWVLQYFQECKRKIAAHIQSYTYACKQYQEARTELDYTILSDAHIIGMTTTGAAKYHGMLQKLRPKIIIIEEAAEVLESHVVTTLTSDTQQVIMIGDHQQLRPKPNDYHLATAYNLEVSLFERLIRNKFPYTTLQVQHRMRPEIAQLICPHIYPQLINASNVFEYSSVKGVKNNVIFLNHTSVEEDCCGISTSHSNEFEARFVVELCFYFIKLGYSNSQITILTTYSSQLRKIARIMQSKFRYRVIRISTVDNFQGEENDIVILSLVRSNAEGRVGFLRDSNRICVALSRAKIGFFVVGNLSMFKMRGGKEWSKILEDMAKKQLIRSAIPLYCPLHDTTTLVSSIEDFKNVPNGGCLKVCGCTLECDHLCPKQCHPCNIDIEHSLYKCNEDCNKVLKCSHKCTRKCFECKNGCGPCQAVIFADFNCGHSNRIVCSTDRCFYQCHHICNKLLSCGHTCKNLCYQACTAKCEEMVIKQIPCGHSKKVLCCEPLCSVQCNEPCKEKLSCGHQCSGDCHLCSRGRLHKLCEHSCTRTLLCGHDYQSQCYEFTTHPQCSKPCNNLCNHGKKCGNECGEPCTPCIEDCQWKCKHHKCNKKCSEMCDRPRCNEPCTKLLKCLHPCIGLCREKCLQLCRKCDAKHVSRCFLGGKNEKNARFIQLEDCGHIFEVSGFDHYMDQQDNETKAVKIQFKCCPKCKVSIRTSLRYGNIIKQILRDMEMIKKQVKDASSFVNNDSVEALRESIYQCKLMQCSKPWWYFSKQFLNIIESRIQDTDFRAHTLQGKLTLNEVDTIHFQLNNLHKILKLFSYTCRKYNYINMVEICMEDIEKEVIGLCNFITRKHLSNQNRVDIMNEFNRLLVLLYTCHLHEALHMSKSMCDDECDLKILHDSIRKLSSDSKHKILTDHVSAICLKLNDIAKKNGIECFFIQERIVVVNEIGLGSGVWFKCPKEHYFCTEECNKLLECPRCKE